MYGIGERVIYGVHGVCTVASTEERVIDRRRITYLVLVPDGQQGARFLVPANNAAAMARIRPVMTTEQLEQMLSAGEVRTDSWIADENQRKQTYRELIVGTDRIALMAMVRTLWRHKAAQAAAGKKCHLCDENFLRDAERLLASEISLAMGVPDDEAKAYLRRRLAE